MKAVGRLLLTYFAGSGAAKWLTISGLVLMLASVYVAVYLPRSEQMLALAMPGLIVFFLGTAPMPLIVGRLAAGHMGCVLPGLRIKLLASAVITVLLVALPVGLLTPLAFVAGMSADVARLRADPVLFEYTLGLAIFTYSAACVAFTWIYIIIWFIGSERGFAGFAKVLAITLLLSALPFSARGRMDHMLLANVLQLALLLVIFGSGFVLWPRLGPHFARWSRGRASSTRGPRDFAGREVDLLLGNARPWVMIGPLALTMLAVTQQSGGLTPSVGLFFLATMSCVSGAVAGQVPARARLLWLLGNWTRADLFGAVERSTWRHNGLVLGVLAVVFVTLGAVGRLSPQVMGFGLALLALGMVLSTYLGLMRTRGTGWVEATLGVLVLAAMMGLAHLVGERHIGAAPTLAAVALLGLMGWVLRELARSRWTRIDWSTNRGETQRALRTG